MLRIYQYSGGSEHLLVFVEMSSGADIVVHRISLSEGSATLGNRKYEPGWFDRLVTMSEKRLFGRWSLLMSEDNA
jgi:hypothetical protein